MSKDRFPPKSVPIVIASKKLAEIPYGGMLDGVVIGGEENVREGRITFPTTTGLVDGKKAVIPPKERDILPPHQSRK